MKASAHDKLKVAQMMNFVFKRVGKIVEKGRNAALPTFLSLFSKRFQKAFP